MQTACLVIAVLLQYLFLVVFCLMLDIGIYYFVHVTLVKISFIMANKFTSKSRKTLFLTIAYGNVYFSIKDILFYICFSVYLSVW